MLLLESLDRLNSPHPHGGLRIRLFDVLGGAGRLGIYGLIRSAERILLFIFQRF